jgi:glycine/D-amino acid oxidase-like deaminating enzyme
MFSKPAGLLSADGGQVDAYKMTHSLLKQVEGSGNKVFDHSAVTRLKHDKKGVEVEVNEKFRIKASKLIIACGYESQKYISKKVEKLNSTFAIISEPFSQQEFWHQNSLIWETATPYLYMKVTPDHRILIGGKDVPFYDPVKRDEMIASKSKLLEKAFRQLFPRLEFKTDFKWAGTFSSTKDGLPYMGSIPERPHTYFALGYGGNGITFSQIAAKFISDQITGKRRMDIDLFSFNQVIPWHKIRSNLLAGPPALFTKSINMLNLRKPAFIFNLIGPVLFFIGLYMLTEDSKQELP